jgi:hypothetical protein
MPKKSKAKYTKVNATPDSNQVLNIVAAERKMYVYEVLDEVLREKFPDYFRKIGCWKEQRLNKKICFKVSTQETGNLKGAVSKFEIPTVI